MANLRGAYAEAYTTTGAKSITTGEIGVSPAAGDHLVGICVTNTAFSADPAPTGYSAAAISGGQVLVFTKTADGTETSFSATLDTGTIMGMAWLIFDDYVATSVDQDGFGSSGFALAGGDDFAEVLSDQTELADTDVVIIYFWLDNAGVTGETFDDTGPTGDSATLLGGDTQTTGSAMFGVRAYLYEGCACTPLIGPSWSQVSSPILDGSWESQYITVEVADPIEGTGPNFEKRKISVRALPYELNTGLLRNV